ELRQGLFPYPAEATLRQTALIQRTSWPTSRLRRADSFPPRCRGSQIKARERRSLPRVARRLARRTIASSDHAGPSLPPVCQILHYAIVAWRNNWTNYLQTQVVGATLEVVADRLSALELDAWQALLHAHHQITRRLDAELRKEHGI